MRIEEGKVRCRTGKYVPKNRTVLALLSMFWLRPKTSAKWLRSYTTSRFYRACCASSKRSNERGAIHVLEAFFFRLHSAKYRKENEGNKSNNSEKSTCCLLCLHIQKSMFISI